MYILVTLLRAQFCRFSQAGLFSHIPNYTFVYVYNLTAQIFKHINTTFSNTNINFQYILMLNCNSVLFILIKIGKIKLVYLERSETHYLNKFKALLHQCRNKMPPN